LPVLSGLMRSVVALLALAVLSLAGAGPALGQRAIPIEEHQVYEVGTQLRCVVCQNLSVADSPSEMAQQMRAIVRERLAAGDSPEQVVQFFVDKYGDWILLSPRRSGFTLIVWIAPFAALAAGLVLVGWLLVRWSRRPAAALPAPVDSAMSERIRRELEAEP
jgi:cytochrome c-type biogenesis protein CcmH